MGSESQPFRRAHRFPLEARKIGETQCESPRIGEAFELHGLILNTYLNRSAEYSGLGYPMTDEIDDPRRRRRADE
jgi:hypothetical protein